MIQSALGSMDGAAEFDAAISANRVLCASRASSSGVPKTKKPNSSEACVVTVDGLEPSTSSSVRNRQHQSRGMCAAGTQTRTEVKELHSLKLGKPKCRQAISVGVDGFEPPASSL